MKTLQQIKIDVEQGQKPYYVYLLFKTDGTPFYVGKGKSNRISAHEAETRYFMNGRTWKGINTFKLNTIKKIWSEKGNVLYKIDSWHDLSESAGEREIELVELHGRRILNEGPLTNIRTGGDLMSEEDRKLFGEKIKQFYIDDPEARERLSKSIKQFYIDNPEAREVLSERKTQFYIDHPEMRDQISQSVKDYIEEHPEFVENLQFHKDKWIEECPEEYAEAEQKRMEKCQSEDHRNKMSEIMSRYFSDNPAEMERLVNQGAEYWADNDEAREAARQRSIDNKSHEAIIDWLKNEPEACREKWDRHSDIMKKWYQENPQRASEIFESRNKVLRSESHRNKMSMKTKEYLDNNPEVVERKVSQLTKGVQESKKIRIECLYLIRDKLVECEEIEFCEPTYKKFHRWRKKGLIKKYFPQLPDGRLKKNEWEDFLLTLAN